MLFLINKTTPELMERINLLAGQEDKELLLVGDGVFYASDFMVAKFRENGVDEVYVSKPCLTTRRVEVSEECVAVDYEAMVPLIMDDHEKTICL